MKYFSLHSSPPGETKSCLQYFLFKCSDVASTISGVDIFIYSCSAQLISFEIESISKEINCAEHEYMNNMSSSHIGAGDATV